jgi:hypothetical protein
VSKPVWLAVPIHDPASGLSAVAASGAADGAQARWVITDLGAVCKAEPCGSFAVDLNERGQVIGDSDVPWPGEMPDDVRANIARPMHAFVWQRKSRGRGGWGAS